MAPVAMSFVTNWCSRRMVTARQSYKLLNSEDDLKKEVDTNHSHSSFSWKEYWAFLTIGVAMMWTWMTILTAVPYLQSRFRGDGWIVSHFESSILIVFAITLLGITVSLTRFQRNVSYLNRLHRSFVACMIISVLLSFSTVNIFSSSSKGYFAFLLIAVSFTAVANGLCQNAAFALVAGFSQPEYTQALVTGQSVAGILPPLIEVLYALWIPGTNTKVKAQKYETSITMLVYFLSGIQINAMALVAMRFLRRCRQGPVTSEESILFSRRCDDEVEMVDRNSTEIKDGYMSISVNQKFKEGTQFGTLWRKLAWPSTAVFISICVSSVYPVFTSDIVSVSEIASRSRLLQAEAYIPLAFAVWNLGELIGSLLSILPSPTGRPRLIFLMSIARIGFIPLYRMCNINGNGAVISSDFFYLFAVQFWFGVTEGWLGGVCVMGVSKWVDEDEREEAGAFLGLSMVVGMAAGSFLSLAVT